MIVLYITRYSRYFVHIGSFSVFWMGLGRWPGCMTGTWVWIPSASVKSWVGWHVPAVQELAMQRREDGWGCWQLCSTSHWAPGSLRDPVSNRWSGLEGAKDAGSLPPHACTHVHTCAHTESLSNWHEVCVITICAVSEAVGVRRELTVSQVVEPDLRFRQFPLGKRRS